MDFTNFIGMWINTKNDYEAGTPPQTGKYNISIESGKTLRFDMEWIDAQNQQHFMTYLTQVDGEMHEYENKSIAEFVKTTLVTPFSMETVSYKNGIEINIATRNIINNGNEMIILQKGYLPSGEEFTNKSIYTKESV